MTLADFEVEGIFSTQVWKKILSKHIDDKATLVFMHASVVCFGHYANELVPLCFCQ